MLNNFLDFLSADFAIWDHKKRVYELLSSRQEPIVLLSSWHQAPKPDKWMDKMWNIPDSLNTPEMKNRRLRAYIGSLLLAIAGWAYQYNTDPKWEKNIDDLVNWVWQWLELAAGRR